jgi:hypothetical protein
MGGAGRCGIGAVEIRRVGDGVFVGLWTSEYETRLYESGSEADFYSITGCGRASIAA